MPAKETVKKPKKVIRPSDSTKNRPDSTKNRQWKETLEATEMRIGFMTR